MVTRVDLVKLSTNSLFHRVTMSGRRRAGSTLSSTQLMDRQLIQGSLFTATSTSFFINLLNQCLNFSLVSEVDKEIGLDYLRACNWAILKLTIIRRKNTIKTLDCMSFLLSRTKIQIYWLFLFVVVPLRGHRRIAVSNTYFNTHDAKHSSDTRLETTKGGLEWGDRSITSS